ncbi:MAG: hypothetical protein HY290_22505 [Planctomycetia bacterium]|nr:hypothetical protein [Planctomycetia bacterium]
MNAQPARAARTAAAPGRRRAPERTASEGDTFFRAAIGSLQKARIPFLVGGAYALEVLAGIVRRTKDFDIFLLPRDAARCLQELSAAGYRTELTFPHWLGKAFCGEEFIDVIFNSGNGLCHVDEAWFERAGSGVVLGIDVRLCPVEEIIWQKAFVLERDRCDVADVAHLLRQSGADLDWNRLLQRFGDCHPVLLAQLVLFDFIFPEHRDQVPDWVRERLVGQYRTDPQPAPCADRPCYGTLLSASQYLRDVDREGYSDVRLPPRGNLTREQIAVWTANFMHH